MVTTPWNLSGREYLHRRYRRATVFMFGGWLAGLGVYGEVLTSMPKGRNRIPLRERIMDQWTTKKKSRRLDFPEINRIALLSR
jgi:hypothetical protein